MIVEQDDVKGVLRECLFDLAIHDAIKKHQLYYMTGSFWESNEVRVTLRQLFPGCCGSFVKVAEYFDELEPGIDALQNNVIILSIAHEDINNLLGGGGGDDEPSLNIGTPAKYRVCYVENNVSLFTSFVHQ